MKLIRIIPSLLIKNNELFKGKNFSDHSYVGDVFNAVKIFSEKGSHEIILLDILASSEKRKPNIQLIQKIKQEIFVPLTFGGGIKNIDDASLLIDSGVEKVSINSQYFVDRSVVSKIANKFGSQSAVVSIDVKFENNEHNIYIHNGKKKIQGNLKETIKQIENDGAGEIILTSINHEGTRIGFDIELYKKIENVSNLPIIAHGGAGKISDFENLFDQTKIASASGGSIFVYFGSRNAVLVNYPSFDDMETFMKKYE